MSTAAKRLILAGGIALAALFAAAGTVAFLGSSPARTGEGGRLFSIEKGETLSQISRHLQEQGFVRFAPLLVAVGRVRGTQGVLKAGYYRIPAGASVVAIHDLLVAGLQALSKITIPEGWTSSKIARYLEAEGVCAAQDFLAAVRSKELLDRFGVTGDTLEGYLFPDTYFVPKPFPAVIMAELLAKTFFERLGAIRPGWETLSPAELRNAVIMASIVEREYRVAEEAPLIASVFYNRLAMNIGLASCATLEYIITEIQKKAHPEYITIDDEKINSPYNTYKWAGLPPGPISNPGSVALAAAFRPARTDFRYFVLQDPGTGRHVFTRYLTEHNEAKQFYLKKP